MSRSWLELMAAGGYPTLRQVHRDRPGASAGDFMLIPTAGQVEALIWQVPYGETRTVADLRADLADDHGVGAACAVATGYHLRRLATGALERLAAGADPGEVAPVWRVLDASSPLLLELAAEAVGRLATLRRGEA